MKLPAHWARLPGMVFSFYIVPLDPAYPARAGRGTFRSPMCLAVPLKVLRVKHPVATVDIYGTTRDVSVLLLPDDIQVGDYVLVHAGFAIQKIDEDAAQETLDLLDEMARTLDQEPDRTSKPLA